MAALLCGGVSCRFNSFYCEESEVIQRNHEFFRLTQFSILESPNLLGKVFLMIDNPFLLNNNYIHAMFLV